MRSTGFPQARRTEKTVFKTLRRRVYGYSDNDYFYLKVGLKQEGIGINLTKLMAGPKILSMRTRFLPILFWHQERILLYFSKPY